MLVHSVSTQEKGANMTSGIRLGGNRRRGVVPGIQAAPSKTGPLTPGLTIVGFDFRVLFAGQRSRVRGMTT